MRQTSRAVALLLTLESASAVDRPIVKNFPTAAAGVMYSINVFNPEASSLVLNSVQLNSRTAPYSSVKPNAALAN
jgi:hypothetical protein